MCCPDRAHHEGRKVVPSKDRGNYTTEFDDMRLDYKKWPIEEPELEDEHGKKS